MIFFEQELRKIAANSEYLRHAKYVGRDCVARLNPDVTVKLSFVTRGIANHYEALCIQLINRREGQIDRQTLTFRDLWGEYSLYGPFYSGETAAGNRGFRCLGVDFPESVLKDSDPAYVFKECGGLSES